MPDKKTVWKPHKYCLDIQDYALTVEKQKRSWDCEEKTSSWKWSVIYHGTVVASGSVNDEEEAKQKAIANVPAA